MNYEQHVLARYPFPPAAHAWKGTGGNKRVYLQKEAILARLALIDPNYQFGRPIYESEVDDVITVTGCLIIGGVEHWAVGTGTITRFRNEGQGADKKRVEISGSELSTERSKATKSAATDLISRLAFLLGIGMYMKRIPPDSKSDERKFSEWLISVTREYPTPTAFTSATLISPFKEVFQTASLNQIGTGTQPQVTGDNTPPTRSLWANDGTISQIFRNFRANVADLDTSVLIWLAGVDAADNFPAWNAKYPTGKSAGQAMVDHYYANRPDVEQVWEATKKLYNNNRQHFENSFKKHVGSGMMTTDEVISLLAQRRQEADKEKAAG